MGLKWIMIIPERTVYIRYGESHLQLKNIFALIITIPKIHTHSFIFVVSEGILHVKDRC